VGEGEACPPPLVPARAPPVWARSDRALARGEVEFLPRARGTGVLWQLPGCGGRVLRLAQWWIPVSDRGSLVADRVAALLVFSGQFQRIAIEQLFTALIWGREVRITVRPLARQSRLWRLRNMKTSKAGELVGGMAIPLPANANVCRSREVGACRARRESRGRILPSPPPTWGHPASREHNT
jgi:hypothetical protein